MQVRRLTIDNFRGIKHAELLLPQHAVLIGDNNVGKTTVLEAIDLVLGPERLNRFPVVDEHDFFQGRYTEAVAERQDSGREPAESATGDAEEAAVAVDSITPGTEATDSANESPTAPQIVIEVVVTGLSDEQKSTFGDHAEWWDEATGRLYDEPNPEGVDGATIAQALRVTFIGRYSPDEDDFEGNTYFTRSLTEDENPTRFGRLDKRVCGFLYLRSLRTGTRALSLERGSLLDIILRLKEIRPQMWETTLSNLSSFTVASDEELGISGVLQSISEAMKKYVPKEWGAQPHLKVSNLTRDHLRKVITAFVATGVGDHAAPFYRQGTGTINVLVLAMLSQIAEDRQNVIFAMEEPERAIPPYAQKRIVQEIRTLASQAIFTSHSPYVLEEFALDETVVLSRCVGGVLTQSDIALPHSVKLKRYRQEFRTRFCEGLLANRILVAEGATEATSLPAAARRLAEVNPERYASVEALGVCTVDAGGESNISDMAALYGSLGKRVFAACDRQSPEDEAAIRANTEHLFMHDKTSLENLILAGSEVTALQRFADIVDWPQHILADHPEPKNDLDEAMRKYFGWSKGNWGVAEFLAQCTEDEMPEWIRDTCARLKTLSDAPPEDTDDQPEADAAVAKDPAADANAG